jgi:ankyrin repeat protein
MGLHLDCWNLFLNGQDAMGDTPLHRASVRGATGLVAELMGLGANPLVENRHGETILHRSARSGNVSTAVQCLECRALRPNARNRIMQTALHIAAELGDLDMVDFFLHRGGLDPSARDLVGRTPRDMAMIAGQWEVVAIIDLHRR